MVIYSHCSLPVFGAVYRASGRVPVRSSRAAGRADGSRLRRRPASPVYVLKVTTRLVTLDLMADDSHGNPVRDLKPEDLQIFEEHKARQKIEHFEYFEKMAGADAKDIPQLLNPSNVYLEPIAA